MTWVELLVKGLFSGGIIVGASEVAKRSIVFGAVIISLPLSSIFSMIMLHRDGVNSEDIAAYAESILYLVLPALALFAIMPILLRRGWDFWPSLGLGIMATLALYGAGIMLATRFAIDGQA
ncbi:MAG TPA: DUF3147 family protein [Candidatus Thalassarchaeaceae archaeon]|nr:MAG TPA: DUF3147 family protein [Candidatus Poseidoniales archaeon]HIH84519.1 DUF3147 family protein [Candidatus Thalassarchaeaceae archaeon]